MRLENAISWILAALPFMLSAGCAAAVRPAALVKADQMIRDTGSADLATAADPKTFQRSFQFYRQAEEAFDDDELDQCTSYAELATLSFETALETAKTQAAEEQLARANERSVLARKMKAEFAAILAEENKRVGRMEKILALQGEVTAQKTTKRQLNADRDPEGPGQRQGGDRGAQEGQGPAHGGPR